MATRRGCKYPAIDGQRAEGGRGGGELTRTNRLARWCAPRLSSTREQTHLERVDEQRIADTSNRTNLRRRDGAAVLRRTAARRARAARKKHLERVEQRAVCLLTRVEEASAQRAAQQVCREACHKATKLSVGGRRAVPAALDILLIKSVVTQPRETGLCGNEHRIEFGRLLLQQLRFFRALVRIPCVRRVGAPRWDCLCRGARVARRGALPCELRPTRALQVLEPGDDRAIVLNEPDLDLALSAVVAVVLVR